MHSDQDGTWRPRPIAREALHNAGDDGLPSAGCVEGQGKGRRAEVNRKPNGVKFPLGPTIGGAVQGNQDRIMTSTVRSHSKLFIA